MRSCPLARCQIPCFNYGPTAKLERFRWPLFSRSEAGNTTAEARATSKVEKTTFAAVSAHQLRAPWLDQRPQIRTARRCATVLVQIITRCQAGRTQSASISFQECTTTCQVHPGIGQLSQSKSNCSQTYKRVPCRFTGRLPELLSFSIKN